MRTTILLLGMLVLGLAAAPLAAADITGDDETCEDNGDVHVHRGCYSIPGGTHDDPLDRVLP